MKTNNNIKQKRDVDNLSSDDHEQSQMMDGRVSESHEVYTEDHLHSVQHRKNYQILKNAYQELEASHIKLEAELALKIQAMEFAEAKHNRTISDAKRKMEAFQKACEQANQSKLTQERLEMIKIQVTQDIEQHYREQITQAHTGIANSRDEAGRLKQEVMKLTVELDRQRTESETLIEHNRMLYEAEVTNLRQIKDDLTARLTQLSSGDLTQTKNVGKENAQLSAKCASLTAELNDLKLKTKSYQSRTKEDDHVLRKSYSDMKLINQELDAERENLKNQVRVLKSECENLRRELISERQRAFDAVKRSSESENNLHSLTQKTRMELSNLRLEAQQQRADIERERDDFMSKCQALEQELDLMATRCQQVDSTATMRELQAAERETKLRDELTGQIASLEAKVAQQTQKVSQTQHALDEARSKEHVEHGQDNRYDSVEDRNLHEELEQFNMRLKEAQQHNRQLASKLYHLLEQQSEESKLQARTGSETTVGLGNQKQRVVEYESQINVELLRVREEKRIAESQLQSVKSNMNVYMERSGKKKRALCARIKVLTDNNQKLELEIERLRAENELFRRNVPQSEYNRIRSKLEDLRRRHEEYEEIILAPTHPFCTLPRSTGRDKYAIDKFPGPSISEEGSKMQVSIERCTPSEELTRTDKNLNYGEVSRETFTFITKVPCGGRDS